MIRGLSRGLTILMALAVLVAAQCAGNCAFGDCLGTAPQHVPQHSRDSSDAGCHHNGQPEKQDQSKPCGHRSVEADRALEKTQAKEVLASTWLINATLVGAYQISLPVGSISAIDSESPPFLDDRYRSTTVLRI